MGAGMPVRRASRHPQIQPREEGARVTRRRSRGNSPVALESPVPQIQAMEEGARMPPRRSANLRPQIHPSEQGAGMPPRRSPRLHPQIEASEEGAGVTCGRSHGTSPVALESLPFNDDMLREVLLRLPPLPSSLPRASAVCKRWRRLVTDPKFIRSFRTHHRKPPLLGVFVCNFETLFTPVLDSPNRIAPVRFSLGRYACRDEYSLLDCRHGLVLFRDIMRRAVVVCDPITGEQRRVAIPPGFSRGYVHAAVLCAAGDQGHIHGGCHSSPFKVVLMSLYMMHSRPTACVYSSETGVWSNPISTDSNCPFNSNPAVLVGNCIYWLSMSSVIFEFDLDENSLTVISVPPVTNNFGHASCWIIQGEDGAVGFAMFSHTRFQLWQRNVNSHGVATWETWKTIEVHNIPGLPIQIEGHKRGNKVIGYAEDTDEIFLHVNMSVYMVQLKLLQSRKLYESYYSNYVHSFKSFYTPGI